MIAIVNNIRASSYRSTIISVLVGIVLYYGFGFISDVITPVTTSLIKAAIYPYIEYKEVKLLIGISIHSGIVGVIGSAIFLYIINVVLRPKKLFYLHVVGFTYMIVSYWWMYSFYSINSRSLTSITNLMALTSLLVTVVSWFVCSWFLVRKNNA